ncbi:hypothetical protein [Lacrimispora celerecrescens]|uniref:hypothetical protein n=1 Tax=Lacrimispora celerecrescens TaxID=29354 RepID=UPI00140AD4B2|nr:hypothetical protein [Lacrimispora celerecrescens]
MLKAEPMTRKRFNDAKSVLNGLYYYAIEIGTVNHNPIKEINFRQFQFKLLMERKKSLPWLKDNCYWIIWNL